MKSLLRALAISAAVAAVCAAPALAIEDPVLNAAIDAGQVGEQADGYLGVADPGSVSQEARARLSQVNLRRRETYTERAQQNNVTVDQYARSFACTLLVKNTPTGAMWRDEAGAWKRNSSGVSLPSYCPN